MNRNHAAPFFTAFVFLVLCTPILASDHRVLPDGQVPNDRRLAELKDYNGYFAFDVPESTEAWEKRAADLRRRVRVATGLWPLPARTPLNAVIHGRVDRDDFTVDKVYFESVPDHFVTGLLFRPKGKSGKLPAVLCPHGHGGRLQDYGEQNLPGLLVAGAERFEDCGRYPKLSRCVQLARMGCVTFIFDMIGYADNMQVPYELAHRFARQRAEFESPESWGLFSTQAELRLQTVMGLQTWNSVRALDFLCGLPDVDPLRVGVTGGSGGGTQTILLCAIDSRPVVAFPQGMVSTAMQGGCTCENCCLLRVGTGNVELTALFAPKPQAMTAANDWTKEMMTKGYPELQQLYQMLGVKDRVMCTPQTHFPHNYNYVTRALMYSWFNKHLELGLPEPIVEEVWRSLTPQEWTVWNDDHPQPKGGADYERALTRWLAEQSDQQIDELLPQDEASLEEYRRVVGGALRTMIGRELPMEGAVEREKIDKQERGDYLFFKDLLRNPGQGEELPVVSFFPTATPWNNQVAIWVDGRGKAGVFDSNGEPNAAVQRLLASGVSVVSGDLFQQGEFLPDEKPLAQTRTVGNTREYAGFSFGYNHTVFARRVHDILTLVSFVRSHETPPKQVHLMGVNGAGPLVAAARAIAGKAVDRAAVDTDGFRFAELRSYRDERFLPGAVKYGDLPALLALSAPYPLWIAGEKGRVPEVAAATYDSVGRRQDVVASATKGSAAAMAGAEWLLNP